MREPEKKHKVLNFLEIQKLGVIGLLVFFINFLMDTTTKDNVGLKDELGEVRGAVTDLAIETKITGLKVDANTIKLEEISKDGKVESDTIRNELEKLERRIYQLENKS